jgi:hypothetical protein
MGSYNHDFVSFIRCFFSVIRVSYGKYGFLSTSHVIKTLSFPVVVVCAFIIDDVRILLFAITSCKVNT